MSIHAYVHSNFGLSFLFLTWNSLPPLLIWEILILKTVLQLFEDHIFETVTKNPIRMIFLIGKHLFINHTTEFDQQIKSFTFIMYIPQGIWDKYTPVKP